MLAADAAGTVRRIGPLRMQSVVRSRRSRLTPRARCVGSAISECKHSSTPDAPPLARLRRAPDFEEIVLPPPRFWGSSRQAPPLSPRVRPRHRRHDHEINGSSTRAHTAPRGMNTIPEAVCGRGRGGRRGGGRPTATCLWGRVASEGGWEVGAVPFDAVRFAGSAQSEVGRIRRQRLRRCTGSGLSPRPASRSLPDSCSGPRWTAICCAVAHHLAAPRGPRDEALATSRPPTMNGLGDLSRTSHRCSSRGCRGAVPSGVFDPRGAEAYLTVRRAPRGEKTSPGGVHRRPQQETGEKCGLGPRFGGDRLQRGRVGVHGRHEVTALRSSGAWVVDDAPDP